MRLNVRNGLCTEENFNNHSFIVTTFPLLTLFLCTFITKMILLYVKTPPLCCCVVHAFAVNWTNMLVCPQVASSGWRCWPAVGATPVFSYMFWKQSQASCQHHVSFMWCVAFSCAMSEGFLISCSHFDNHSTLFIFCLFCMNTCASCIHPVIYFDPFLSCVFVLDYLYWLIKDQSRPDDTVHDLWVWSGLYSKYGNNIRIVSVLF